MGILKAGGARVLVVLGSEFYSGQSEQPRGSAARGPIIIAHFWLMADPRGAKKYGQVSWGFTYNNPTHNADEMLEMLSQQCSAAVFQKEKGKEGTEHYQGYVKFLKKTMTPSRLLEFQAHWLRCDANFAKYCQKEDTRIDGPWSLNTGGKQQGKRNDMDAVTEMIREGKTNREIAEDYPGQMVRYQQHFDRFRALYPPVRENELQVTLFIGPPGTGKTRKAYDLYPNIYALPVGKDLWFNAYQGQREVLIDDFSGNVGLTQLLQILDRYPVQVPTKGGFVWWCPDIIIITSNTEIDGWYKYGDRVDSLCALKRRIHNVERFGYQRNAFDNLIGSHKKGEILSSDDEILYPDGVIKKFGEINDSD